MKKLLYVGAIALLGLGLSFPLMTQNATSQTLKLDPNNTNSTPVFAD